MVDGQCDSGSYPKTDPVSRWQNGSGPFASNLLLAMSDLGAHAAFFPANFSPSCTSTPSTHAKPPDLAWNNDLPTWPKGLYVAGEAGQGIHCLATVPADNFNPNVGRPCSGVRVWSGQPMGLWRNEISCRSLRINQSFTLNQHCFAYYLASLF